jgi:hypothetical protein
MVVKLLDDSDDLVCPAAINCLASLGPEGTYSIVHFEPFALLTPLPSGVTAGSPVRDFHGGEIAGAFRHAYSPNRD